MTLHTTPPLAPPTAPATVRYDFADLVGCSAALRDAIRVAERASTNELPVLLRGESGVGKEVFAQAIHAASARRGAPFVAINCAALPRELIESELFGYAPGAFTGAHREGGIGKFEATHGGTLFLDEIGELSGGAQAALLRVLQEGEITRIGESRRRPIDVRIIAATQRRSPAAGEPAPGALRTDLYYRLAVLICDVPPLRERLDDLPALVDRFLADACCELRCAPIAATADLLRRLAHHDWPGNVRELRNLIRRLVALAGSDTLDVADLPVELRRAGCGATAAPCDGGAGGEPGAEPIDGARLVSVLSVARTASAAARALGISRSTLYRWMKRHGVEVHHTVQPSALRR